MPITVSHEIEKSGNSYILLRFLWVVRSGLITYREIKYVFRLCK